MKNYRKTPKPETGTEITYNIHGLKLHPEKLTKYIELKEPTYEYNKDQTPQQNWNKMEKQLQTALVATCPHTKDTTTKGPRLDKQTTKLE